MDSVCVDLPLLHVFVAFNCLGILSVKVVVWDEDREGVHICNVQTKIAAHEQSTLPEFDVAEVRADVFKVVLHEDRAHWQVG